MLKCTGTWDRANLLGMLCALARARTCLFPAEELCPGLSHCVSYPSLPILHFLFIGWSPRSAQHIHGYCLLFRAWLMLFHLSEFCLHPLSVSYEVGFHEAPRLSSYVTSSCDPSGPPRSSLFLPLWYVHPCSHAHRPCVSPHAQVCLSSVS